VRVERPVGHARFGKAEPCSCVLDEADDVRRTRLERISNLDSLTRFTFTTLSPGGRGGDDEGFAAALDAARGYADAPEGWLVLSGPSGSGKTHLAAAIANEQIRRGSAALFMVVPDLLDHLRAGYDAGDEELSYTQIFEQVRSAPLLILDDIDAAAPTDWAKEKLFQVVNHRFNANLATVFTSTTPPQQMEDRFASRLADPRVANLALGRGDGPSNYHQVGGMARERLAAMTFATFDPRGAGGLTPEERSSLVAMYDVARRFAEEPSGWLTLQGVNGCGKTHLAAAIANRALARGEGVFFAVVPDLLDHLRASFAPGHEVAYDELFDQVRNAPLLILDDLGAQHTSPWAQEKLYQIVNYRTVAGLPGVVTTDRLFPELIQLHPRIAARLGDSRSGTVASTKAPHFSLGRTPAGSPRRAGPGR
jgi:DNA replication protein DnaC